MPEALLIGLVLLAVVLVLVIVVKSIFIVPQKQVMIVERLGRFHKRAEAGLHVLVPFLDAVRSRVDMREQITSINPQPAITKDNVTLEIDAVIYFTVMDAVHATYEIQNLHYGLEQLTLSALRSIIGELELDHTLTARETVNARLRSVLDTATAAWGVKIMRVEIKNIQTPQEIRLTMEKQMTAERNRRAAVTTAEGEKSAAVLRAEGQKQSQVIGADGNKQAAILLAEGHAEAKLRVAQAEAQAIQLVSQALGQLGNPSQYLIAQKYLESLNAIAANAQKVVFLPYEASGVMGSLASLKELMGSDKASQ